jgi:Tol biopolymer transport system component
MQVEHGTRLGPYEIVSRLGAGGMGEVWQASDTRLERSVAIKILPAEFARNAQLRLRFDREAKTISQLTHPNICTLYDVGENDGVHYLVMELLDGESLADRVLRGPLPLPEVLRYGREIAEALARAHRQGVVHRDLKPGNVMLTKGGAKLLDFGLSKSLPVSSAPHDATDYKPLTQEGTVIGTFQYMAPEQIGGDEADHRSDIFALGVVLYEMATGKRAFSGATRTSLIAAIVGAEPRPLRDLQPLTPPALEHVIAKCLEKDPERRWQSAHDIAEELRWIHEAGSQAGTPAPLVLRKRSRERMAWTLAAVLALAVAAGVPYHLSVRRDAARPFVADIAPPQGLQFHAIGDDAGPAVISPDGRQVVFAVGDGRHTHLRLRSLETGETRALNGTEAASFPFWSPDSKRIGFATVTHLKYVDLEGGAPVPIVPVNGARGAAWSPDGTIVYSRSTLDPLFRVNAGGGTPSAITKLDSGQHSSHRWPAFLPDGKRFLFLATNHQDPSGSSNAVFLASTEGGPSRMIMRSVSNAAYHDGHLFFARDRSLFAQPVDDDLAPSGQAVRVADSVLYDSGIWRTAFSLSDQGVLLVHSGGVTVNLSSLQWLDRAGKEIEPIGERSAFMDLNLSPDGRKLAVIVGDPNREVWVHDFERRVRTKISVGARWIGNMVWSPDGSTLYVDGKRGDDFEVIAKRLTGGERSILRTKDSHSVGAVSPDGRTLLLETGSQLVSLSLDPPGKEVRPLVKAPTWGSGISPNGRWISHDSFENGRSDVVIVSAADPTIRWQISADGGWGSRWRRDGKEIFYIDLDNRLTAVTIDDSGPNIDIGTPRPLFRVRLRANTRAFEVNADGSRFLVNTVGEQPSPTIVVYRNWKQRLTR